MLLRICEIAEVGSGLVVARKKAFNQNEIIKKYKQFNLRSINKNGYIIESELEILEAKEKIDDYYLTHEGDIIIRLTDPFTAVYIDKDMEGIVISSNFCIVRCKENYSSKFLTYYINSENAKKKLFSNLQGSVLKNINMTVIADLEIPNVPFEKQKIIGKLLIAQTKRIIILERIKELEIKQQKLLLDRVIKELEVN